MDDLLLDAFGWAFVQRHADHPFLKRLVIEPVASQFPSTTTAHLTTLYTGLLEATMPVCRTPEERFFFQQLILDRVAGILLTSIAVILLANGFTELVLAAADR